jgi:hypothetical protein
MNFLEFLGIKKLMKDSEPSNVIKFPEHMAAPKVPEPPKEYYRVGRREDGMTTLTVMSGDGWGSITLAMNDEACEQMIRMIRATYADTDN